MSFKFNKPYFHFCYPICDFVFTWTAYVNCMRLAQDSITFSWTQFFFSVSLFLLHLLLYLYVCSDFLQTFADRQVGIHPNRRREGGWRTWLGWGWMRVVMQNYREELLLALAVSAVTVERPKQLRSTHPSPSSSLLPSPSLRSAAPNIKGSLWHGLS